MQLPVATSSSSNAEPKKLFTPQKKKKKKNLQRSLTIYYLMSIYASDLDFEIKYSCCNLNS